MNEKEIRNYKIMKIVDESNLISEMEKISDVIKETIGTVKITGCGKLDNINVNIYTYDEDSNMYRIEYEFSFFSE